MISIEAIDIIMSIALGIIIYAKEKIIKNSPYYWIDNIIIFCVLPVIPTIILAQISQISLYDLLMAIFYYVKWLFIGCIIANILVLKDIIREYFKYSSTEKIKGNGVE